MSKELEQQLDCALDLMRRMPPTQIEDNLTGLIDLVPDLTERLLSCVDQPLKFAHDSAAKKDYLLCDWNRDGDSFRSPWTNKYDPPLSDGNFPSKELRNLEVQANDVFDVYRDLYYEGGVSSVYCMDLETGGFATSVLVKKIQDTSKKGQPMKGTWDAIHVVEVKEAGKKNAHYKLTSTVMLSIETKFDVTGSVSLAGSLTRQAEQDAPIVDLNTHIPNIGRMIEDMELKLRNTIEFIYFGKTKDIVNELRNLIGSRESKKRENLQKQIGQQVGKN